MARQKRQKKSTATNQAKTFEDVVKTHEPPFELNQAELKVFHGVIASREWDTWSDDDIVIAGVIAQVQVEAEKVRRQYLKEGHKVIQANGNEAINPTFSVWTKLVEKRLQLRRQLGLSASQKGLAHKEQRGRNQQQVQKQRKLASVSPLLK